MRELMEYSPRESTHSPQIKVQIVKLERRRKFTTYCTGDILRNSSSTTSNLALNHLSSSLL